MFQRLSRILGCGLVALTMAALSGGASAQKVLDEFQIHHPSLSYDGRYLAFDFYLAGRDRRPVSHNMIAIYDLEQESVQLHIAPPPRGFYWPSFSPDGQYLTMIQRCWTPECSDDEVGTNIGLLHLDSGRFRLLTTAEHKQHRDAIFSNMQPKIFMTLRSTPVFSNDMAKIYYSYGVGPTKNFSSPLTVPDYWTGQANKIGQADVLSGIEKDVVGEKEYGVSSISWLSATDDRIYFVEASNQRGEVGKKWYKLGAKAGFMDLKSNNIQILFENTPYFDPTQIFNFLFPENLTQEEIRRFGNFLPASLSASRDGSSMVFTFRYLREYAKNFETIPAERVYFMRNGEIEGAYLPNIEMIKYSSVSDVAISGDGKTVATFMINNSDFIAVANFENRVFKLKNLREKLRKEINSRAN